MQTEYIICIFNTIHFRTNGGNLCWGHAVSEDLLHWKQLDTVMFPEKDGSIFSGCGIVNERGLLKLPESALLFFYTMAGGKTKWSEGKKFTQRLAYSLDGGKTLQKTAEPVIDHIADENRDPKVYWHENSQAYYMVLFLEGHRFGIFRSENLQDWECTQTLELDEAWECPDLREIPVEDGGSRWVFWSADGFTFWENLMDIVLSQMVLEEKRTRRPFRMQHRRFME